jgi:hypothetical protein
MLALTSPTSGGRSVGTVRSTIKTTELLLLLLLLLLLGCMKTADWLAEIVTNCSSKNAAFRHVASCSFIRNRRSV